MNVQQRPFAPAKSARCTPVLRLLIADTIRAAPAYAMSSTAALRPLLGDQEMAEMREAREGSSLLVPVQ
jgi:hypothetical protein